MSPRLVVVVEDDPMLRQDAAAALTSAGFAVADFETADEALSFIEGGSEDIAGVLTDVRMPGALDGFDLAVRLSITRPSLRVLLTSGLERPQSLLIPAVAFLPKPWSARDVVAALRGAPVTAH